MRDNPYTEYERLMQRAVVNLCERDAMEFDSIDISKITLSDQFYQKRDRIIRKRRLPRVFPGFRKPTFAVAIILILLSIGALTAIAAKPIRETVYSFLTEIFTPSSSETETETESETVAEQVAPLTPPPGVDYNYELIFELSEDGTYYTVLGLDDSTYPEIARANAIYIPPVYEGKPIKAIGEKAFYKSRYALNFFIPEGVERIEAAAFQDCSAQFIQLPKSLQYIGNYAFSSCDNLQILELSDNISYIGSDAFNYCEKLKSIHLPPTLTVIEPSTFAYCFALEEITIPDSVTFIGNYAFSSCRSLKKVTLSKQHKTKFC